MAELILGMIGAILAIAAYKGGFYIGQKSAAMEKADTPREEIPDEIKEQREQLVKDIQTIFNYKGSGRK